MKPPFEPTHPDATDHGALDEPFLAELEDEQRRRDMLGIVMLVFAILLVIGIVVVSCTQLKA